MNCKICDEVITQKWVKKKQDQLNERQLCFTCNFWHNIYQVYQRNDKSLVVIDGTTYSVGKENEAGPKKWRGFSGRKFVWVWNDGVSQQSTNMWHRGGIPEGHWQNQMPDNASWEK